MVSDSLTTEELKSRIGVEGEPRLYEIEKGLVQRFAKAIDDPNPLWQDEEYAGKSKYRGIIAPPALIIALGWEDFIKEIPYGDAGLHASTEVEFYQPVRAGDIISITNKLVDVRERHNKELGTILFLTCERTYKNQRQEVAAKCWQRLISYKTEDMKRD